MGTSRFVKVPLLIGTNTDEATTYMYDLPPNTNADFFKFINDVAHVGNDTILPILYPDIPAIRLQLSYLADNERPTGNLLIFLSTLIMTCTTEGLLVRHGQHTTLLLTANDLTSFLWEMLTT